MFKQSEWEIHRHRKLTKATMVERINPITTKNQKNNEFRILAAMDNCFGLVRPRQHGITNT